MRAKKLTCRYGPIEEDRIGYEDEQHRGVCGDIVRDSVLEALLTTARKWNNKISIANHSCTVVARCAIMRGEYDNTTRTETFFCGHKCWLNSWSMVASPCIFREVIHGSNSLTAPTRKHMNKMIKGENQRDVRDSWPTLQDKINSVFNITTS